MRAGQELVWRAELLRQVGKGVVEPSAEVVDSILEQGAEVCANFTVRGVSGGKGMFTEDALAESVDRGDG